MVTFNSKTSSRAGMCWWPTARALWPRSTEQKGPSKLGLRSNSRPGSFRSEERRVGKECRFDCDWSSDVCSSDLRYVLVADGAGFMATEYGAEGSEQTGTPIELKAGQLRKGIVLSLAPKGVVCGRVTDDHGNPLPKVEVYAFGHFKGSMWLMGG